MQPPGWVPLLSALLLAQEGNGEWPSKPHLLWGPRARCWQGWPRSDHPQLPSGRGDLRELACCCLWLCFFPAAACPFLFSSPRM